MISSSRYLSLNFIIGHWNVFFSVILQHVQEGKVLDAIEMTEQLAPKLLESNMDLHFDLLTLHFIDLIRTRKW